MGRIGAPHGIRGEVALFPESDDPNRFAAGAEFGAEGPETRTLVLVSARPHKGRLVAAFEGVTNRDQAEQLRGVAITIPSSARRPLTDGEYWPDDLVGLEVRGVSGQALGRVSAVELGTAQDRLIVETAAGPVQVPLVEALVPELRLEEGVIVVDPPSGLFPGEEQDG